MTAIARSITTTTTDGTVVFFIAYIVRLFYHANRGKEK
jgi:hypothetical protein